MRKERQNPEYYNQNASSLDGLHLKIAYDYRCLYYYGSRCVNQQIKENFSGYRQDGTKQAALTRSSEAMQMIIVCGSPKFDLTLVIDVLNIAAT